MFMEKGAKRKTAIEVIKESNNVLFLRLLLPPTADFERLTEKQKGSVKSEGKNDSSEKC